VNRQEKSQLVTELKGQFTKTAGSIVVGYKGLTVNQLQKLRRGVRQNGGSLKVTKARLMRLAAQDIDGAQSLIPYFKDQIGLVFVEKNDPAMIKFLHGFSKENEALKMVAGLLDSQFADTATLSVLATLPSREVLLAQVCGVIKAPIAKLAFVLQQISKKKQ
jgi:large subunit ribosomal protein L10